MKVTGMHMCVELECPECGYTEQIEEYDELSEEGATLKWDNSECSECAKDN
jgi:ribosomal protein S27AE